MGDQAEKLFYDDIRDKKRTGSGAFKRTGKGVKNGIQGGMRYAYQNMDKADRYAYTKPGEVVTISMDELITKDDFLSRSEAEQKALMERWRNLYDNKRILQALGITYNTFYNWIDYYGIQKKTGAPIRHAKQLRKTQLSAQKFEEYKHHVPSYDTLKKINRDQQCGLIRAWEAQMKGPEIAKKMGVPTNVYRSMKYNVKQAMAKQGVLKPFNYDNQQGQENTIQETASETYTNPTEEPRPQQLEYGKQQSSSDVGDVAVSTHHIPESIFSSEELVAKLQKLIHFIDGEPNKFQASVTIYELPNTGNGSVFEDKKSRVYRMLSDLLSQEDKKDG